MLDVGCSSGYLARPSPRRGRGSSASSSIRGAAEAARSFCADVLVGDVESMELPLEPASFDAIVCGDLVEHLRDPRTTLERLRPLLRPDGRLVLSTPNVANWAMRLSLLGGRWRYTDRGILDRTHTHLFTRKTLVETVEAAGYRVVELDHTAPVPRCRDARRRARRARDRRVRPSLLRLPVRPRCDAAVISVVIPVKNGGADLARCLAGIAAQEVEEEVEVVVVDSGSTDGSLERARARRRGRARDSARGVRPRPYAEPRASSSREARRVVFTSQDAVADDADWLARLAAAARSGPDVAGAYGRQLPHPDARPPERFFLDFLYGPEPRVQRLEPGAELTFEATLFSNVNAAIPRAILERFPFRDDLTMSEDQEWSRRVLRDGLRARLRAARGGPPFARVHRALGVPAVLRLGRVGRARLRRGRRVARGAPARGRALCARGARVALASRAGGAGSRTRSSTSSAKFAGLQLGLRHHRLPRALGSSGALELASDTG